MHSDEPAPLDGMADEAPMLAPRLHLEDHERTRLSQASSVLDEARCADLGRMPAASLIRMVEQLRSSLDDLVQLMRDLQA